MPPPKFILQSKPLKQELDHVLPLLKTLQWLAILHKVKVGILTVTHKVLDDLKYLTSSPIAFSLLALLQPFWLSRYFLYMPGMFRAFPRAISSPQSSWLTPFLVSFKYLFKCHLSMRPTQAILLHALLLPSYFLSYLFFSITLFIKFTSYLANTFIFISGSVSFMLRVPQGG